MRHLSDFIKKDQAVRQALAVDIIDLRAYTLLTLTADDPESLPESFQGASKPQPALSVNTNITTSAICTRRLNL